MKKCQLCGKELTIENYYSSDISLENYPEKPPKQLFVNIRCKEVFYKKLNKCEVDGVEIKYGK